TGAFGKWHNGSQWPYHPCARGFDEYFGYTAGHWGEYFNAPLEQNGRMIRTEGYIVDVCTDRAIEFIDRSRDKPFFCFVPFTTPHSPWAVPDTNWQRLRLAPVGQKSTLPKQENLDETRCALAMLENQDANVGRVLAKLDELRISRDTIVIYFSDNGPNSWRWNGGMKGRKGSVDEGGVRSTCFIRWPTRIAAGIIVKEIAGAIDLLPTLTALAGVERVGDEPLDGRDLTPLLTQSSDKWPDRMLFTTWSGKVSVRTQQHRLDESEQLFDMVADPAQTVAVNDREPQTAARLIAAARAWREEMAKELGSSQQAAATVENEKNNSQRSANAVDERPLPVGYREFPVTMLPARDGEPQGGVKRSSSAPNCSYFVNWTAKEDSLVWRLDVHTAGRYEVTIDYTCPEADAGSLVELACGESRLTGRVTPGWDPPLYDDQDTLPRPPAESKMKEFRTLKLGELRLESGVGSLKLRAIEIPGKSVMDVRRVTLTLLD
ncbi:MAG TPA: sulfatase-like hydrolase/transferase, partial [Pirellulales bacterium]